MLGQIGIRKQAVTFFLCVHLLLLAAVGTSLAAAPVSCDTKGWISSIGLEWVASNCIAKTMTDNTALHYGNNFVECNGGNVSVYASYGDSQATPASLVNYILSQGYKVFRNKEGSHVLMVHPLYKGVIDGKDMTRYATGQVYTDVFSRGLVLPQTPLCNATPPCKSCPCPEIELGSSVNLISGRLSHTQELFSAKGGQMPQTLTLDYRSMDFEPSTIGSGWSHSSEQSLQVLANGSLSLWHGGISRNYRLYSGVYFAPAGDYSTLVKNADGSYLLTEKEGLKRVFDSSGHISAMVDRNGNTVSFVYASGTLQLVTDPSGRNVTFTYDLDGRLSVVTDPGGARYVFTYSNGLLSAVTAPGGGTWNYTYANGVLLTRSDPGGSIKSYGYDASNRVLSSVDPVKQTRSIGYAANSVGNPGKVPDAYPSEMMTNKLTVIEKNSAGWTYVYNYPGATVKSVTDPYGNSTEYTYDTTGNRLSMTEPGIVITRYTYDVFGNRLSTTDPQGAVTTSTYNSSGQIMSSSGPQGVTAQSYDARGNLLVFTDVASGTTVHEYDSRGNITKVTNAGNQSTVLSYTVTGYLASSTDPDGVIRTYSYDTVGNMLTSNGPEGGATYRYDVNGHLLNVTDTLGQVTSYVYDKLGNLTILTDANGGKIEYSYNYQGQATRIIDALGAATSLVYGGGSGTCPGCSGGVDTLTTLTDARSQTTSYSYDLMSRMTKETDSLGNTTLYGYDAAGNVSSKSTANGIIIMYEYDNMRRLTKKKYPDSSSESYSYDVAGRMLISVNKDVSYGYMYDSAGRLTKVTDSRGVVLEYESDILGNRIKTTMQKGTPEAHVISYGYDQANRPATIGSSAGIFAYVYDGTGHRSNLVYPHGVTGSYGYDSLGRLTSIKHMAGNSTITFADYGSFDKVGNRKSKNTPAGGEAYIYDPVYRLLQAATPGSTETFTYDSVGNRVTGPGPKDRKYLYDAGNRMLAGKQFGYLYDANGNQLARTLPKASDKSWVQSWDAENRLIRLEKVKGAVENRTVTYKYDPLGRRIEKKIANVVNGLTKISTWFYVYDNENIALEIYTDEVGTTKKSWYTHGVFVDEHLAVERDGQKFYYHADGLGSVTAITDSAKNLVQSYGYESFGMVHPSTDFRNSYTYTGREWDKEAGLYYYRARYYDPVDGRFISKDPIGIVGGINGYSYVFNNPTNWIDPAGMYGIEVHYYMTLYLAGLVGFNAADATKIANADQSVDDDWSLSPFNYPNGTKLHFMSRLNARSLMVNSMDSCSLGAFGTVLHIFQDTFSHAGFTWKYGHLFAGTTPDNFSQQSPRDAEMMNNTMNYLQIMKRCMDKKCAK